jgi:small-conductance mechanosensitive channel
LRNSSFGYDILTSIPNSVIANAKMINESAPVSMSRIRIKVGVAYGSDLKGVERTLSNVAEHYEEFSLRGILQVLTSWKNV